jgi:RimJ/RimL family protein N-acetyltransferase
MTLHTSLDLLGVRIETERLVLTPVCDDDVQEIFNEFTQQVTLYMHPRAPQHIGETQEFITSTITNMQLGKELVCTIRVKTTNEFLGEVGFHEINTPHPELGIWIKKSGHGNKYGREAVTAITQWGNEHVDYEYIVYPVARDNVASRKVAESLGGVVVKEYENTNLSGITWPFVEYHIKKSL